MQNKKGKNKNLFKKIFIKLLIVFLKFTKIATIFLGLVFMSAVIYSSAVIIFNLITIISLFINNVKNEYELEGLKALYVGVVALIGGLWAINERRHKDATERYVPLLNKMRNLSSLRKSKGNKKFSKEEEKILDSVLSEVNLVKTHFPQDMLKVYSATKNIQLLDDAIEIVEMELKHKTNFSYNFRNFIGVLMFKSIRDDVNEEIDKLLNKLDD